MATITTLSRGGDTTVPAGQLQSTVLKLDFVDLIADFTDAGGVTTDSVKIMDIPADTFVEVLAIEVIGASISLGAGARIDVGDTGSATRYVSNASTVTNGTNLTIALIPYLYTAADTLLVKITGGTIADGGGLRFVLRLTDLTRVAPAVPKVYTNV